MSAILFGSISTIADTSELQREAFNKAFTAHGLDWNWSREDYLALLESSGGEQRIAEQARSLGQSVDAAAVHATKSQIFRDSLPGSGIGPRPGVVETVQAARGKGMKVGLVTTTSHENVTALLAALDPALHAADFDVTVDASVVPTSKPDKAAYCFALERLGESADDCVAIEDNLPGVDSAVAAGLPCVAFPNQNTSGHSFTEARVVVDRLEFSDLQHFVMR